MRGPVRRLSSRRGALAADRGGGGGFFGAGRAVAFLGARPTGGARRSLGRASSDGGSASSNEGSSTASQVGHTAASSATVALQVGHLIGATV